MNGFGSCFEKPPWGRHSAWENRATAGAAKRAAAACCPQHPAQPHTSLHAIIAWPHFVKQFLPLSSEKEWHFQLPDQIAEALLNVFEGAISFHAI